MAWGRRIPYSAWVEKCRRTSCSGSCSSGKGRTSPLKGAKLPKIDTIDPWDGKDGEMPVEEEIDLSDVELDDLDKDEL